MEHRETYADSMLLAYQIGTIMTQTSNENDFEIESSKIVTERCLVNVRLKSQGICLRMLSLEGIEK